MTLTESAKPTQREPRPRLLDLFCGAGGAARGYQMAGFHVTGVDIVPQPRYAGDVFIRADALTFPLEGYDAIHASPPCQAFSSLRHRWDRSHPDLIAQTREQLTATRVPWVIENVRGAGLLHPVMLCGSMFGLGASCRDGRWRYLRRHRYFESPWLIDMALLPIDCAHGRQALGVYGTGSSRLVREHNGYQGLAQERRDALGIDWMTKAENAQAIPPAYTEWIGLRLLEHLRVTP